MKNLMRFKLLAAVALLLLLVPAALGEAGRRVVYLTFDDGPKADTPELVGLLSELDVPATFFFVGQKMERFPENARLVARSGHAIGSHGYRHSRERFQQDEQSTFTDQQKWLETARQTFGENFETDIFRFPGGSTLYSPKQRQWLENLGYAWFDWSGMTGDAQFGFESDKKMLAYTLRTVRNQDVVILLMHEGVQRTRHILPELVSCFRDNGYEFRMLSTDEQEREILAGCKANMAFAAEN